MKRVLAVFHCQAISERTLFLNLCWWNAADLPGRRKLNRHVINFFVGIFKVDGMDAVGVFENALLHCTEYPGWDRARFPALDAQPGILKSNSATNGVSQVSHSGLFVS